MKFRYFLFVCLVFVLAGSCGGAIGNADSGGIDKATGQFGPGDYSIELTIDNRARHYLLHVPSGYSGKPLPLVIDVHGYTGTPQWQKTNSGMWELSDKENFVVAWPRGGPRNTRVRTERGWNASGDSVYPGCCGRASYEKWDDVAAIVAIKNDIKSKVKISKSFYTGLSNGSWLGHRILCEAPGEFDAYALTSAQLSDSWDDGCEASEKRPIIYMHGRDDTVVDIEGSDNIAGEYMLDTDETMEIYAERNKCAGYPDSYTTIANDRGSWCREYKDCGVSVAYCELESPHVTYDQTGIDVARVFWDFLKKH